MIDDQTTPTEPNQATAPLFTRVNLLIAVLLAMTMLAGAYFRFAGQDWDEGTHLHPDERFLTDVTSRLQATSTDPNYPFNYFDTAHSRFNPNNNGFGFYVYGDLPIFAVKLVATIVADIKHDPAHLQYGGIYMIGRSVSALSDLLTILVTFAIGRRLYGKWAGLLAAMFYTGAVLPIQLSHFATVDAFTTLMVALTMWFAVRVLLCREDYWFDYVLFGLSFGAAMASRVNVLPLAGMLVLAAIVRMLPAFELDVPDAERWRIFRRASGLLVLGGVVSIIVFRIAMPYAFEGPSFFNVGINSAWISQIRTVQAQVSGQADFPPNHQWACRTPYLFALENMVRWGLGVPLGMLAWLGWAWGVWRVLRGREDWTRSLLPAAWILIYFGWQGRQWVMSMRYYVILYPMLCIFAAWALLELLRLAREGFYHRALPIYARPGPGVSLRARPSKANKHTLATIGATGLLITVLILTLLYAYGFTGIYRRPLTRVAASRWFYDNVPGDLGFYIKGDGDNGTRTLVNLAIPNGNWKQAEREAGDTDTALDTDAELIAGASRLDDGIPYPLAFTAPESGTVDSVFVPHLGDPNHDPGTETLRVVLATDVAGMDVLTEGQISGEFGAAAHPLGGYVEIALEPPVYLEAGQSYYAIVQAVSGGPITTAGAIVATEGDWDDPIPYSVDGKSGFGNLYQDLKMFMFYEDAYAHDLTAKRDIMLYCLDHTDYLTISSNRFYDSLSRNPVRWPMSIHYYKALFSGALGYELDQAFYSFPSIGPIELNDRSAEEAFHVYDHPIVMVFRRTERYDPQNARAILEEIDLNAVLANGQPRADAASVNPTQLSLPDALWQQQTGGGTWAERYDSEGPLATNDALAIALWWGLMVALGWAAFPVLFAVLPGLPDRAYPLAKVLGLIVIGWLPWLAASAGVALWNAAGVTLAFVVLGMFSIVLTVAHWQELEAFVKTHWRRMLIVEVITLALYLFWVYVRLNNPDLWHNSFGGEKPMDFAYMNAVLRSTGFPPLDPWFAGGYINYYYFGYVIVGAPVLLLKIPPAIAYNLIVPTLYARTGIGAFSLGFNLVEGLKARHPRDGMNRRVSRYANPWIGGAAALVFAVVLGNLDTVRVIMGGLAQTGGWSPEHGQAMPSLAHIVDGLGKVLGGGVLQVAPHRWYWQPSRVLEVFPGNAINEFPYFTFIYADLHAHMIAMPITLLVLAWALGRVQSAEHKRGCGLDLLALAVGALSVGVLDPTNHWDWITYLLVAVIALSFTNLLRLQHASGRTPWAWLNRHAGDALLIVLCGLFVLGTTMLTVIKNDFVGWITITMVGVVGLAALRFLRIAAPLKSLALRWVGETLIFLGMALCAVLPFNLWFGSAYSKIEFYQSGDVTPLWAYLDMHGIFLFIVASFLLWETVVWLRKTRISALEGKLWWVVSLIVLAGLMFLASVYLAFVGLSTDIILDHNTGAFRQQHYESLLVSVPLLFGAALLFFRRGQGREKQSVLAGIVLALALTIGVEFVVLVGDIGRQNTIFKFYIQVWLIFSVVSGAAVAWLIRAADRWYTTPRVLWTAILGLLITIGALFPITATHGKFTDRMSHDAPKSLDGMAYMRYALHGENGVYFDLKEDYDAIRWLQENIQGTPVILEAHLGEYHWGARVSIYTGMPTVLGWNWHQRQQRAAVPQTQIWNRAGDIATMYNDRDVKAVWALLQRYDVSYIIVGRVERASYDPAGLAKFEAMARANLLVRVYEQGDTVIYEVKG